jgi:hypothetical protein
MKKLITSVIIVASLVAALAPVAGARTQEATPYFTSICCTPAGNCATAQVVQDGTPCWCNVPGGWVGGNAC